jgi:hypothetical protein
LRFECRGWAVNDPAFADGSASRGGAYVYEALRRITEARGSE